MCGSCLVFLGAGLLVLWKRSAATKGSCQGLHWCWGCDACCLINAACTALCVGRLWFLALSQAGRSLLVELPVLAVLPALSPQPLTQGLPPALFMMAGSAMTLWSCMPLVWYADTVCSSSVFTEAHCCCSNLLAGMTEDTLFVVCGTHLRSSRCNRLNGAGGVKPGQGDSISTRAKNGNALYHDMQLTTPLAQCMAARWRQPLNHCTCQAQGDFDTPCPLSIHTPTKPHTVHKAKVVVDLLLHHGHPHTAAANTPLLP